LARSVLLPTNDCFIKKNTSGGARSSCNVHRSENKTVSHESPGKRA
jgi:hypothetical protein